MFNCLVTWKVEVKNKNSIQQHSTWISHSLYDSRYTYMGIYIHTYTYIHTLVVKNLPAKAGNRGDAGASMDIVSLAFNI